MTPQLTSYVSCYVICMGEGQMSFDDRSSPAMMHMEIGKVFFSKVVATQNLKRTRCRTTESFTARFYKERYSNTIS